MTTVVQLTRDEIRDAYSFLFDESINTEQLEWVVQEMEGRVNNFIDTLLETVLSDAHENKWDHAVR